MYGERRGSLSLREWRRESRIVRLLCCRRDALRRSCEDSSSCSSTDNKVAMEDGPSMEHESEENASLVEEPEESSIVDDLESLVAQPVLHRSDAVGCLPDIPAFGGPESFVVSCLGPFAFFMVHGFFR